VTTSSGRAYPRLVSRQSAWRVLFVLGVVALFVSSLVLANAINDARPQKASGPAAGGAVEEEAPAAPGTAVIAPSPETVLPQPPAAVGPLEPATARHPDPVLLAAIQDALGDQAGHFGVVVVRLNDGRSAVLNGDQVYYAASLFKLAILYEAGRQVSAGTLDLDSRLHLTDADVAEDLGTLGDVEVAEDGTELVSEALRAMVTLSDNTSAVALLHRLGGGNIDATLRDAGIETTSVNTEELPTTASDMARIMELIVRGEGVSEDAKTMMRDLLLHQGTRTGIPQGVPRDVSVGNKTGNWEGATHDVAFVDAPGGTYIIAVLSDGSWDWDPLVKVSSAVYAAMTRN
jgi:beta-lactamase class A